MSDPTQIAPPRTDAIIANLAPWDFWCKIDAVVTDEEIRIAMREGRTSEEQNVRINHILAAAQESLIAMVPISRSLS